VLPIFCLTATGRAQADLETYTIDGQPVLLYKIIQWWYDAPDAQGPWICGRSLACRTRAPLEISYAADNGRISLGLEAGFAELVWPKIAGSGGSAASFHPLWMDPAYVVAAKVTVCSGLGDGSARLSVGGVTPKQVRLWMQLAAGLELILAGPVCGLMDDRVALVGTPQLIKACPQSSFSKAASKAMTLTLRHRPTDRVLVVFALHPTGG
jgi:hypothetical protein